MAALLIVSDRCEYCGQTVEFIKKNPVLMPLVNVHNITTLGIPKNLVGTVKRVPTLITPTGEQHVGLEVIRWLEMNVPCTFEGASFNNCGASNYEEPFDGVGDSFPLDAYGMSLSPIITPALQKKIDKAAKDAFEELKNSGIN
jgi:hypothetical protein